MYAFEPHLQNFGLLTNNVSANRLSNVAAVQKAVSNLGGQVPLLLARSSAGHSLNALPPWTLPDGSEPLQIAVLAVTLDEFFEDQNVQPKLIKIDIEGAEPRALAGMHGPISKNPQIAVILELNPAYLDADGADDLLKQLASLGFQFAIIDEVADQLARAARSEALDRFLERRDSWILNLFCSRDETLLTKLLNARN